MKFTTLASGSSGNAAVISCGDTHILLDAGISARRITTGLKQLGIEPEQLSAILVTHDHADHICGLAVLTKKVNNALEEKGVLVLDYTVELKGANAQRTVFTMDLLPYFDTPFRG